MRWDRTGCPAGSEFEVRGFRNCEPRTSNSNRLSAAYGQMNDRTVFSTGPALCSIRKRETEQRDFRDRTLFCPGKTTIGGPVNHTSFPCNPSGLRIGKAHTQEVGQLRTGARTG